MMTSTLDTFRDLLDGGTDAGLGTVVLALK